MGEAIRHLTSLRMSKGIRTFRQDVLRATVTVRQPFADPDPTDTRGRATRLTPAIKKPPTSQLTAFTRLGGPLTWAV
jgi:hypothetical protein